MEKYLGESINMSWQLIGVGKKETESPEKFPSFWLMQLIP